MTRSGSERQRGDHPAHPWGARASRRDCVIVRSGSLRLHPRPGEGTADDAAKATVLRRSVLMIKGTGGTPVLKIASASGHKESIP